jgi:arylsulfatase A-like enzyme
VHFQTTDVHEPHRPVPPFAGTFVSPAQQREFFEMEELMYADADFEITSVFEANKAMIERSGIDGHAYFDTMRGLYDEAMAHQDYRLGQFVESLKASGEWDNTILLIGSDHGHPAGTFTRFGRGLLQPAPPDWEGAMLGSFNTKIPLMVVWPGHIEGGQRFRQPVSMIDILPTVLDLAGLPLPDVLQGQSLAPLLLGRGGWEPRPVILDEFRVDAATGEWTGNLEMIDGRWGASLEIAPVAEGADPTLGRHAIPAGGRWGASHPFFPEVPRLMLYDLWADPRALHNVNAAHPDLVAKYTELLQRQWEAHRALSTQVTAGDEQAMTPEQLRTLRALGYIQ